MMLPVDQLMARGRAVIQRERDGLEVVLTHLDEAFAAAVQVIHDSRGRVAVTGMGKAGLVGAKIAATLASTGTPAFVVHPVEAIHGDLGMVHAEDVVLALSNSGESEELVGLLPIFRRFGCRVILMTGRPQSRCARSSDIVLNIGPQKEACALGMAPSTSTTALLALGDALALTLSEIKGFACEQYAAFHPGGALGRSLMRVEDIMRTGSGCPTVQTDQSVAAVLDHITAARAGAAVVVDGAGRLAGFFSLGDLGRLVRRVDRPGALAVGEVMTRAPKSVEVGQLVADALQVMRQHQIDELPVVNDTREVVGLIDVQDLISRGFSLFDAR